MKVILIFVGNTMKSEVSWREGLFKLGNQIRGVKNFDHISGCCKYIYTEFQLDTAWISQRFFEPAPYKPGFHLQQTSRPRHKKQSDYLDEQSSFPLIALFWSKIDHCRGRNWLYGNQAITLIVLSCIHTSQQQFYLQVFIQFHGSQSPVKILRVSHCIFKFVLFSWEPELEELKFCIDIESTNLKRSNLSDFWIGVFFC